MDGFTRRKEQSKEEIRKAAWELFSRFGVEKVSIVDIARKSGVSQATIYNNFGSKDALAREFVNTVVDRLVNQAEEVLSHDLPYWEKMAAFFEFISAMMADGRSLEANRTGFTNSIHLQNDPEIKKIRDSAQERMATILMGMIREGKEQGHIETGLSDEAYRIYFKVFMDVFIDPDFQQGYFQNPGLVRELGAIMVHGLSGR